ncbi:hypothetical protein [Luteibacter sp. 3190]|uniref:hypothetical protein n=1 Tax=Luteibacter sp. 3190 TaxID=2817736 RepID=UPI002863CD3D|nr:hypothetical protein [Luteibacter sp. 3190]MDR6935475.1 hypothetical protein [Luteibacter sp. 3190]
MEYVLVLDAGAPSARLNAGYGVIGRDAPDAPPRFLFVTCSEVDTSHNQLLRVKVKEQDQPVVWLPYSHVVAIQEGPGTAKGPVGFGPH